MARRPNEKAPRPKALGACCFLESYFLRGTLPLRLSRDLQHRQGQLDDSRTRLAALQYFNRNSAFLMRERIGDQLHFFAVKPYTIGTGITKAH